MKPMTKPVLVLGGTGMIGFGVVSQLEARGISTRATTRHPDIVPERFTGRFEFFDAANSDLAALVAGYGPGDVVVNTLGLIKQYIRDEDLAQRSAAIVANAELPTRLAALAVEQGFRVIHITTDCVYSGSRGGYTEADLHDPVDVYGSTKSLGEIPSPAVLNIRCSVIGPELRGFKSLLHWVLDHAEGTSFDGYTDHEWNGVTSVAFGRVVAGLVSTQSELSGTVHLVPADSVSKFELSGMILREFGVRGVAVEPVVTGSSVNRVLATDDADRNARLWRDAGYASPPSIVQLVTELADTTPANGEEHD